jgi:hypothetical protein
MEKDSDMRKIDAFAHILPRSYLELLQRQLEKTMGPSRLDYYLCWLHVISAHK